ncbi:MAG TPA: thiamine-phosphate kinase [Pseudomonadales bacterium]|nr:thiamine-phosphate kinase [Pseudomonadales bacterium]
MDEFDLIDVILAEQAPATDAAPSGDRLVVGPGDDAAVLNSGPDRDWVLSTDTLVAGRHFPEGLHAGLVGRRALAVNLSDLAAMGADPGAFLVALTHPQLDADWARAFARGLAKTAEGTGAHLAGGNLARGPLSVTVTVTGSVPAGAALLRSGARPGDLLYVSGRIGDGHAGLRLLEQEPERLAGLDPDAVPEALAAYLTPQPRVALGRALRERASACVDVSDGLMADLTHLCRASGVGARVLLERVPCVGDATRALVAGDDYELLFTLPAQMETELTELRATAGVEIHRIGRMTEDPEVLLLDGDGERVAVPEPGWTHF